MGEGVLAKDFQLSPGPWTDEHAVAMEDFLEDVVATHVTLRSGSYVGQGRSMTVPVSDFGGVPKVLVIQPQSGGTAVVSLVALPGTAIAAWSKTGFTLSDAASVNTQSVIYNYAMLG